MKKRFALVGLSSKFLSGNFQELHLIARKMTENCLLLGCTPDIPEFIDVVLEESVRHLTPQELSMVSLRSTRIFTALTLDRQGIGNKQETLSWQEIQEFMAKNGTVTLCKKAK